MMHRRESIELFYRNLVAGRCDEHLRNILSEYEQKFASFNFQIFTKESFITSIQHLCGELFGQDDCENRGRVISLLGFSLELDRYHKSHSREWYTTELLINVLTDELCKIDGFSPRRLLGVTFCILI